MEGRLAVHVDRHGHIDLSVKHSHAQWKAQVGSALKDWRALKSQQQRRDSGSSMNSTAARIHHFDDDSDRLPEVATKVPSSSNSASELPRIVVTRSVARRGSELENDGLERVVMTQSTARRWSSLEDDARDNGHFLQEAEMEALEIAELLQSQRSRPPPPTREDDYAELLEQLALESKERQENDRKRKALDRLLFHMERRKGAKLRMELGILVHKRKRLSSCLSMLRENIMITRATRFRKYMLKRNFFVLWAVNAGEWKRRKRLIELSDQFRYETSMAFCFQTWKNNVIKVMKFQLLRAKVLMRIRMDQLDRVFSRWYAYHLHKSVVRSEMRKAIVFWGERRLRFAIRTLKMNGSATRFERIRIRHAFSIFLDRLAYRTLKQWKTYVMEQKREKIQLQRADTLFRKSALRRGLADLRTNHLLGHMSLLFLERALVFWEGKLLWKCFREWVAALNYGKRESVAWKFHQTRCLKTSFKYLQRNRMNRQEKRVLLAKRFHENNILKRKSFLLWAVHAAARFCWRRKTLELVMGRRQSNLMRKIFRKWFEYAHTKAVIKGKTTQTRRNIVYMRKRRFLWCLALETAKKLRIERTLNNRLQKVKRMKRFDAFKKLKQNASQRRVEKRAYQELQHMRIQKAFSKLVNNALERKQRRRKEEIYQEQIALMQLNRSFQVFKQYREYRKRVHQAQRRFRRKELLKYLHIWRETVHEDYMSRFAQDRYEFYCKKRTLKRLKRFAEMRGTRRSHARRADHHLLQKKGKGMLFTWACFTIRKRTVNALRIRAKRFWEAKQKRRAMYYLQTKRAKRLMTRRANVKGREFFQQKWKLTTLDFLNAWTRKRIRLYDCQIELEKSTSDRLLQKMFMEWFHFTQSERSLKRSLQRIEMKRKTSQQRAALQNLKIKLLYDPRKKRMALQHRTKVLKRTVWNQWVIGARRFDFCVEKLKTIRTLHALKTWKHFTFRRKRGRAILHQVYIERFRKRLLRNRWDHWKLLISEQTFGEAANSLFAYHAHAKYFEKWVQHTIEAKVGRMHQLIAVIFWKNHILKKYFRLFQLGLQMQHYEDASLEYYCSKLLSNHFLAWKDTVLNRQLQDANNVLGVLFWKDQLIKRMFRRWYMYIHTKLKTDEEESVVISVVN